MAVDCLKPGPRKPWKQYVDVEITEGWTDGLFTHYVKDGTSLCGTLRGSGFVHLIPIRQNRIDQSCHQCMELRRAQVEAEQLAAMNRRF